MKLSSQQLEWISQKAKEAGFLECKNVELKQDPNFEAYQTWVDQKHHQPLDYLARNKHIRQNPKEIGESLNSAFVFLHPYPKEYESKWIARYAWGKDYHHTLKSKLFELVESFEQHFEVQLENRICVDTAPLLERSLAQQAGLGWIAKNGCLIHREHGSFFLIACWLTSLKAIETPEVSGFHCGKCTRCLDACPTDAFIQPGMIETQKCLSTVTIENRQEIPSQFIDHLNHQVFGCDICQEVCPWNRKTDLNIHQEYLPDLDELLSLPEPEFRDYFRKTALTRPGWNGLRRNFLIAAAHQENIGNELFEKHLSHQSTLVQNTAKSILVWRKESC